jgi:hypothetical protein
MMNCARRKSVYALFIGVSIFSQNGKAIARVEGNKKDLNSSNTSNNVKVASGDFQWKDHGKLAWEDFRGPVNATSSESAAATDCGIGFKTVTPPGGGTPEIVVYNTFFVNKSWVRSDAKIPEILEHEQGHFDLCEIYTRKLRERMNKYDLTSATMKKDLLRIYDEVSYEYEKRQDAYENETSHGTNLPRQEHWTKEIAHELAHEG